MLWQPSIPAAHPVDGHLGCGIENDQHIRRACPQKSKNISLGRDPFEQHC
jgi:hypothetical protein